MKLYWSSILVFIVFWLTVSTFTYSEHVWWSIFSANRSTHIPLIEQISFIKVILVILVSLGIWSVLRNRKS